MKERRGLTARRRWLELGPAILVAVASLVVSGCSPGADYPSLFPAVHDMPPPRPDATLDPVQVQQATESLITDRNHLTAESQSAGQKNPVNPSAAAVNSQPVKKAPVAAGNQQGAITAGAQTAGTETK